VCIIWKIKVLDIVGDGVTMKFTYRDIVGKIVRETRT